MVFAIGERILPVSAVTELIAVTLYGLRPCLSLMFQNRKLSIRAEH